MAFDLAKTKLEVLEKYGRSKTIKSLQMEVERNRSDELAKQAKWELEKSKQAKLERQIAACTLVAPVDGLVAYGNEPSHIAGQSLIEEGARSAIGGRSSPLLISAGFRSLSDSPSRSSTGLNRT